MDISTAFRDSFPTFMKKEDRLIPTVGDLRAAKVRIGNLEMDKVKLKKEILELKAALARLAGEHI